MRGRLFLGILGLLAVSCGSESVSLGPGPPPEEMCTATTPIVAAYDRSNGDLRWVSCSEAGGMFIVTAASDDTVWVEEPMGATLAFDAESGAEVGRSDGADPPPPIPNGADRQLTSAPTIDGVSLSGGQDDPLRGSNSATGTSWERVGYIVYDDVWAAGDGAVRWETDETTSMGWPWHVEGQQLFVMWWNLEVRSTTDGSLVWATDYADPESGYPRMFGAVANADSVFVSFTSIASGGD